MSDTNLVIAPKVIEVITNPTNNFITQVIEVNTPILSAAQGPQGIAGVSAATSIATNSDVDLTGLTDGAMLIYQAEFAKWKSTTVLDKQVLESGQY